MLPGVTGIPTTAIVSRRVTVTAGAAVVDDSAPDAPATVQVAPPRAWPTLGTSPRLATPYLLRWRPGAFTPLLQPGDRVTADGTEYEALSTGRPLSYGLSPLGYETPMLPVGFLYPLSGQAHDQGSAPSGADIPVAIWAPVERHAVTGSYEDLQGEAPIDFASALEGRNRLLTVGPTRYRIVNAVTDLTAPRVDLRLTRAG